MDVRLRLPKHLDHISVGGQVLAADAERCVMVAEEHVRECLRHGLVVAGVVAPKPEKAEKLKPAEKAEAKAT